MALSAFPCAAQSDHFADRVLLGLTTRARRRRRAGSRRDFPAAFDGKAALFVLCVNQAQPTVWANLLHLIASCSEKYARLAGMAFKEPPVTFFCNETEFASTLKATA
jgi:hypothetical protein